MIERKFSKVFDLKGLAKVIEGAKKGRRRSQNAIMDYFWNDVYTYVYTKLKNEEEAEDIAIVTFTKVFSKLKLYNSDFDFKTWVISIAHNTMIDHIRRSPELNVSLDDEEYPIEISEDQPTPEESLIRQQDNAALISHLNKMKPEYKRILELRFLEEKTYKEIAAELGLSMANVKVRLLRARHLLRNILQG